MIKEFEKKVISVVEKLIENEHHIIKIYKEVFEKNPVSIIDGLNTVFDRVEKEHPKTTDKYIVKSLNNDIVKNHVSSDDLHKPIGSIYQFENNDNIDRLYIDFWFDTNIINIKELIRAIQFIGFAPHTKMYYDSKTGIYYINDKDILDRYINKKIIIKKVKYIHKKYYIDKQPFGASARINGYQTYINKINTFILDSIKDNNQFSSISYSVDPFISQPKSSFKDEVLRIIDNKLLPIKPEAIYDDRIIDDYKQHFNLDDFLDFLIASRFGDTKRAYMWFRAPSDFGKSFLFEGVIGGLGISSTITESELKTSQTGSASGWTAETFKNSWMLFVDEFSSNVKEFKNITHKLSFSPKFKGTVTVDMYAKVFASAENVFSLNMDGYVEEQFRNRFIFWHEKTGKLKDREVFKEGQLKYKEVIQTYVFEYLKRESDKLIALGKYKAEKVSTDKLEELRSKYAVDDQKNIEDLISERRNDLINHVLQVHDDSENNTNYNIEEVLKFTFKHKKTIYVNNKGKMADFFRKNYFSDSEIRSVGKKSDAVMLGIDEGTKRKNLTLNMKSFAGYEWLNESKYAEDNYFQDISIGTEWD